MDRATIEAEVLTLTAKILMGNATEEEIKRVTKLAIESNCQDILIREFESIKHILKE